MIFNMKCSAVKSTILCFGMLWSKSKNSDKVQTLEKYFYRRVKILH